jgi:hypothetical protein
LQIAASSHQQPLGNVSVQAIDVLETVIEKFHGLHRLELVLRTELAEDMKNKLQELSLLTSMPG